MAMCQGGLLVLLHGPAGPDGPAGPAGIRAIGVFSMG